MGHKITIGTILYPSKTSAKKFYRTLRDRYEIGARVNEVDHDSLLDLIGIHHHADQKIGCGISHFSVELDKEFGKTRHFMIHRVDGSSTDVSFIGAIDGPNERNDQLEALRRSVEDQVVAFKNEKFAERNDHICPLSGLRIGSESYHVDHAPPNTFIRIVNMWLLEESMKLEDICITPPLDNQYVTTMTNESQKGRWQEFHRSKASLRLLSPIGNLSAAKKKGSRTQ